MRIEEKKKSVLGKSNEDRGCVCVCVEGEGVGRR